MIEIMDPKSPSGCPSTPGSVHEIAKKFSFNSPPQSNKTSPSRVAGGSVGGAKSQTTPMKATLATSEMTRGSISSRLTPQPGKMSPSPENDVQLREKRIQLKIRPASWDPSLIFNSEKSSKSVGMEDLGGSAGEKQFNRKENGRLPIRKKVSPSGEGEKEQYGEEEEGEEPIVSSATGENLSQEELRRISVRERTQRWEARGSELPSFFTLPKSFRSKGGAPLPPVSPTPGSRIPPPRSSNTPLTQSLKARNMYSKQSTPPIQV